MSNGIKVKKRNGRGTESLNLEKMHRMVEEACKGLAGVSDFDSLVIDVEIGRAHV